MPPPRGAPIQCEDAPAPSSFAGKSIHRWGQSGCAVSDGPISPSGLKWSGRDPGDLARLRFILPPVRLVPATSHNVKAPALPASPPPVNQRPVIVLITEVMGTTISMQEHAPAPHMKGVVWEYFRGGNRDGPGHNAGWSSASRSGPAGAGFCPAWAKPGGLGARLGRGRRGGPDRGELSASGEVPEPEEVRASAALVVVPVSGACLRALAAMIRGSPLGACLRCVGWPAARARGPLVRTLTGWPARGRMAWGEVEGGRRTMTRTATAQGCRASVCHGRARVTWPHRRAGCRADGQPGRGRGAGCPPGGGVGRRRARRWDSGPVGGPLEPDPCYSCRCKRGGEWYWYPPPLWRTWESRSMRESCLGGGVAGVGICGVIWSDGQPGEGRDRPSYHPHLKRR